LTNSHKPLGIVEALGFRRLEEGQYLWRKGRASGPAIQIIRDVADIRNAVQAHHVKLIDDMASYALEPMLLVADDRQSLVFFSIKQKDQDVLWFDLMYASDQAIFAQCAQTLANTLLPDKPSVLAADSRFVSDAGASAEFRQLPVSRYFISRHMLPSEIDNLYSELQLLDLKLD